MTARADILLWDPGAAGGSGGTGTWDLTSSVNWWNGNTSADVTWKDNSTLGTNTAGFVGTAGNVTLNTSLSASNLVFTTPGYTISGSGTLTIGGNGGIDATALSSGATVIGNPLSLAAGQQQWRAGSGSTLGITGAITRGVGATVDYSATGVTNGTLANVNDILGGWATVGAANSSGGDWATKDVNGNVVTYTGYTLVSGTQSGAGASAQNWKNTSAGAGITLSGSATINSFVQQGDLTIPASATLTLGSGGLILNNISRWMLASSTSSSLLTSGAGTGELFIHAPMSSADYWILWPVIADNGGTPVTLVKDGAGFADLANNNTYTGGTIVNAGVLATVNNSQWGQGQDTTGFRPYFGTGTTTVNGSGQVRLGWIDNGANGADNRFFEFDVTNAFNLNGGVVYAWDGFQHLQGPLNVSAFGGALGATFDNKGDALLNGFAKGLWADGNLTGAGPLSIQHSGLNTGNAWNSSVVYFTSPGTAAQNTYSGTVTVNPFANGGSYLYLIGTNALANATINLAGDNSASAGRFGSPTLLFGSGTNADGVGYATIGGLTGSGSFVLANTRVTQSSSSIGGGVALTVGNNNASTSYSGVMSGAGSLTKIGNGTLTLSGANTYTGDTTINGGTIALTGAGTIVSANIRVASGAAFDVSALGSLTLSGGQTLSGSGTNNGSIYTSSGTAIYAGLDGTYGTNQFNNDLSLASGAVAYFDVSTTTNGSNDRITVAGTLTANNNIVHVKAPSTSSTLQANDYTLFTSPNPISGSFASAPSWDVQPLNFGNFTIVTSGNTVKLHYAPATAPTAGGSAIPNPAVRNQNVQITVTTTNGTGGTVNSVTVDASAIGGSSSVSLVSAGGNVWTNSVIVTPDTLPGAKVLVATVSDTASLTAILNIPLAVAAGNDVWNGLGADDNFTSNLNWTNQTAPGYVGDSLEFAGSTRLTPNVDHDYTITSITFDSGAGNFTVGGANTLTLTNATLVNNGANNQTLGVPITLATSATFNSAVGDLTLSGAIANGASPAGITKIGNYALTLSGSSTFTGPIIANGGSLTISGTVTPSYITGGSVAGKSVINLSGSVTAANLFAGNTTNAVSAIYQTGGTLTLSGGSGDLLAIGNWTGSYGYYNAAGGTLTIDGIAIGGESNPNVWPPQGTGDGILEVNGATISNTGWITLARGGGLNTGILNVYSGSLTYAGGGIGCNWNGNASPSLGAQTSIINILGGSVTSTSQGLEFRTSGNTGILNLNGGLLEGTGVIGSGTLNFNGGTLQAAAGNLNFIALSRANVYGGGGTIDNNGAGITVGQALLAPSGNGVYGITSFTGGAGYIAPPIVTITNGTGDTTGTGATAIAQINPTTGVVTNILITCPGRDYTATPVFLLKGGGATTDATITGAAPQPNVSGGLTFIGAGVTGLSNVNTYAGSTVISNGTMGLAPGGSLASTNIITYSGAVFDVSSLTFTLGADQALSGYGNVNGSVTAASGSKIAGGLDGTYGTNTFNNDLTLSAGATVSLDLGTAFNGDNDLIVVTGTLTGNGNSIHVRAPSSAVNLDTTDYVLITAGTVSGTFSSAPVWDVAPLNAGHYSVLVSGNTVTLHYNAAAAAPTVTAAATPTSLLRNQPTRIVANVTPGTASISTVTVDLSAIGGSSSVSLVQSNASNVYTNTVTVPAASATGNLSLTVTATDTAAQSGSAVVSVTVNASTEVWNGGGANQKWTTNPNWASGYAPGYASDSIIFAGLTGLTPDMDTNYSVGGLTFDSTAGGFTLTSVNNNTLTLTGGVTNNSTTAQTVNSTVALSGSQTINAASGNITIAKLSGSGSLTKAGNNTLALTGAGNALGGNLVVKAGAVNVTGGSSTFSGTSSIGYLTGGGNLLISGASVTNTGELRVGASDQNGSGINATGTVTVASGTLSVGALTVARGNFYDNTVSGLLTLNSGGTVNSESDVLLDFAGGVVGKLVVNGGTLNEATTTKRWLIMSTWDSGSAQLEVNSGQVNLNAGTDIRFAISGNNGTNVINLNGGAITLYQDNGTTVGVGSGVVDLHQGYGASTNTFNLNGGVLTTLGVLSANTAGTRTFNFNGGTLKATTNNASFVSLGSGATANVRNGGAVIDDGGWTNTIPQALVHSTIVGDSATDGGLTKLGAGTLILSGANTYNGNTTVKAGILELTVTNLATSSTVSVSNSAVLQLDFATTNQVGALILGGVTQPAGLYDSTSGAPYITGSGKLLVGSAIATNPTNITFSVSGNSLSLTWPGDHLGWILQTNATSLTDTNAWFQYPGSSSVTNVNVPINPSATNVFFRLIKP